MSELLALADRCEKATEADRELDALIVVELDLKPDWLKKSDGELWVDKRNPDLISVRFRYSCIGHRGPGNPPIGDFPHFTGSIDAAMTLGDPAAEISISTLYGVARVEYPLNYADAPPCHGEHVGGLIAPAICAAILRARAEMVAIRARAAEVRG